MREGDHVLDESRQGEATVVAGPGVNARKLYLESYGCQMNFSIVKLWRASCLSVIGYQTTRDEDEADLVLLNTCAIRDNAEQRVRNRLVHFKVNKRKNPSLVVGVLGCMAERLRDWVVGGGKARGLGGGVSMPTAICPTSCRSSGRR